MTIGSSAASLAGFDPSRGVHVKGVPLTDTSFLAVSNFNQLQTITRHPNDLGPVARITGYDAESIAEEAELHALVQRALTGNKKQNVPPVEPLHRGGGQRCPHRGPAADASVVRRRAGGLPAG